jgi:hypothetical protein
MNRMNRRAASEIMSWVLVMSIAVVISAFMFDFMTDYSDDTTKDIKKIVYNTDECRSVSLSIESACLSSQTLNITLQNRNYIRIDKMDFRIYNGNVPLGTNETNVTLNPNRIKTVSINAGTTTATRVEVIPRIIKENEDIICGDKKATSTISAC